MHKRPLFLTSNSFSLSLSLFENLNYFSSLEASPWKWQVDTHFLLSGSGENFSARIYLLCYMNPMVFATALGTATLLFTT